MLLDRTRLGAMIRAGVDDPDMARVVGIRVSQLFTIVFALGAGLAGFAGIIGGPILSVYPGLDQDMLPLALVVVILGGTGSLLGSFVGSIIVGFIYNFGQALLPELAYFVLFLPMLLVLIFRPQGLFGRQVRERPRPRPRCGLRRAGRPALLDARHYYINVSSQVLFYAIFALGLNILVGYGGLVSLGHAGLFGITAYATAYLLAMGFGHTTAILGALAVSLGCTAVFAALALRATGIGFIMITLALGQIIWGLAYRWISLTGGDNGINVKTRPAPFGYDLGGPQHVLLFDARRFPGRRRGRGDLRALAVRRGAQGHPRPAAPDERARLSRLGDPLLGLPAVGPAHRRRRDSVRLLHPVHQPADHIADASPKCC